MFKFDDDSGSTEEKFTPPFDEVEIETNDSSQTQSNTTPKDITTDETTEKNPYRTQPLSKSPYITSPPKSCFRVIDEDIATYPRFGFHSQREDGVEEKEIPPQNKLSEIPRGKGPS